MSEPTILLLSAYRADSHGAWADWLVRGNPQVRWQRLELPGRHFRWRIRGNALSWLDRLPEDAPDRVLATSMVDLATLRGLHPRLATVPAWYYFHENQFAYPVSERQHGSVDPQMVQLYGALAAERVLFNSAFNRDSFLDGVEALLARMPDQVPPGVRERIEARSQVLPVPVKPLNPQPDKDPKLILWNHRWEYDKDPELFAGAMIELAERGVDFRLALLGQRPARGAPALERLRASLRGRIVADGRVAEDRYREWLGLAGIVVSTARHEFQGLAVLEAASAGARPLVPDALCYPEQYSLQYRYHAGDQEGLVTRLQQWLTVELPEPADVSPWCGEDLPARWARLLSAAQE
jgi:glycosyltransferase involved in cell wall biosynthesis